MKIKFLIKSKQPPKKKESSALKRPLTHCCHQLQKKVNIVHRACKACSGSIWPGQLHLKCSHCLVDVHAACKELVANVQPKCLSDFILMTGISVPDILVNCLAQIECRGLETQGLYRVPGDEQKVKALTANLMAQVSFGCDLADVDVHVLCGAVKEFLRSLKHPLVSSGILSQFLAMDSEKDIKDLVCLLPPPQRDTLAFLMLHLQKVTRNGATKMSAENLATVLAMSVFGIVTDQTMSLEDMLMDNREKRMGLEKMIKMDPSAWKMILTGNV